MYRRCIGFGVRADEFIPAHARAPGAKYHLFGDPSGLSNPYRVVLSWPRAQIGYLMTRIRFLGTWHGHSPQDLNVFRYERPGGGA